MGRPALRKKGPMTAAERQRRRRRKLRREKREAEMMAEREKNAARYRANRADPTRIERDAAAAARADAKHQEWLASYGRPPLPDANGAADELARQIDEYMAQEPGLSIDDVRKAIDRRFGAG
jgi:hypothetical protein